MVMAVSRLQIEQEMDGRITALGFELVSLEWAGSHSRPIVRIRMDKPDSSHESSVTVNDCVYVSRALEEWLDQYDEERTHGALGDRTPFEYRWAQQTSERHRKTLI